MKSVPLHSVFFLCFATVCLSSSFIFVRESGLGASALACCRLFLAVLLTLPLFLRALAKETWKMPRGTWWRCGGPGIFFGLHLIGWNIGCRLTTASNATLLVNLVPVVLPFLLVFVVRERISRPEIYGTVVAFAGMVVMAVSDYHFSPEHLHGDAVCFAAMFLLAIYMALVRKSAASFPSTWLFTVPVWTIAGFVCLIFSAAFGEFDNGIAPKEWLPLFGLVVFTTLLGHGLFMLSLRSVRGQVVALFSLGQCIPAAIMAYFIYGELPHGAFYIAATFILAGVSLVVTLRPKGEPPVVTSGSSPDAA